MGSTPTRQAKHIRLCYGQLEAISRNSILNYFQNEILIFNIGAIVRNVIYDSCYERLAVKIEQYEIIIYYLPNPDTVKVTV